MYKPLSPLATECVEQAWDLFQSNDVDRLAGLRPALPYLGNPYREVKRLISLGGTSRCDRRKCQYQNLCEKT
jgi:hypothetical protein